MRDLQAAKWDDRRMAKFLVPMKCESVSTDYVECVGCHKRFVGGDLQDRMRRWHEHAEDAKCATDVDLPPWLEQYLA